MDTLRFLTGASIAVTLAITDTWINLGSNSSVRGRVISIYTILVGFAFLLSQVLLFVFDMESALLFVFFAIIVNLGVVVVSLTHSPEPTAKFGGETPRKKLEITSISANVAAFSMGVISINLTSVVPFYLSSHGVSNALVSLSLGAMYQGRILFQWPIGLVSDRVDRRLVLVWLGVGLAVLTVVYWLLTGPQVGEGRYLSGERGLATQILVVGTFFLVGGFAFPVYSVAIALAFDRIGDAEPFRVSTTLLIVYSAGTIFGPVAVSATSYASGNNSLILCTLTASSAIAGSAFWEKRKVTGPTANGGHIPAAPTTSTEMAHAQADAAAP